MDNNNTQDKFKITTIAVSKETKARLDHLRKENKSASYSKIINYLVEKELTNLNYNNKPIDDSKKETTNKVVILL